MTLALSRSTVRDRRRWLAYGLLASLVLNAFLIGLAATDFFRPGHVGGPLRFELRWLQAKLPDSDFGRLKAAVDAIGPSVQAHIDRMREMRVELGTMAAAPQPDRAAIDRKLADIRSELDAMTKEGQETITATLLSLPPESRARLAETSGAR